LYDLQIKLESGEKLPVESIYSLLAAEQEILKEFISRNLNTELIHLIFSLHRALILFVKKKDGFL